jgi:hypothetical protein
VSCDERGYPIMVSKLIYFVAFTAALSASLAWSADFRNNNWGASPADVVFNEGEASPVIASGPYSNNESYTELLYYSTSYQGVPVLVFFIFTPEEKLAIGFCIEEDAQVSSFFLWEEALSRLYGEPEVHDEILTNDVSILDVYYQADPRAVEEGVLNGYFALVRYWETETTRIWLAAEITGNGLMVDITYHSREYFDLYRDEEEKGTPGPRSGLPPWYGTSNE